jgi:ribosomal 50S subunit-associated protein YjgA (DUF615 family)
MYVEVDRQRIQDGARQKPKPQLPWHMRHRMFHKPVVIERRRLDRDRVVTNTKVALESLVHEWPLDDCPRRQQAMKLCLAVMRGEKPPVAARRAFVAAARAANILREA